MNPKRRVVLVAAIMVVTVLAVEGLTIHNLYRAAISEERSRLEETAQSQARLIEAVARFDAVHSNDYPEGARQATIDQVKNAHALYHGFGDTGEFTLSVKKDDTIVFLLSHRHYDLDNPKPVPWDSKLAAPMRRALSGESGTMIGIDYRGTTVVAAYEPVAVLGLGIVAKIDLAEIRRPFIRAGAVSGLLAVVIIAIGVMVFFRVTSPILENLNESVARLEGALAEVRTLEGILPICSHCKRIRNDHGRWDQLEVYVRDRSHAEFSHGICPDCLEEHYGDVV